MAWPKSALWIGVGLLFSLLGGAALAQGPVPAPARPLCILPLPPWLPHYDLDIRLELDQHSAQVRQQVTWTNRHQQAANELVFNVHSHFRVPDEERVKLAKTLEVLRMRPQDALDAEGECCQIQSATLPGAPGSEPIVLPCAYQKDNQTALVVTLPAPVAPGQSITVVLDFTMRLPQKMGRWGQWSGVTYLSNWLPVLAFYDEKGWQPTPFIPWHQPFFNESGIYRARVTLPADQKIACSGIVESKRDLPNCLQEVHIAADGVRDFAFLCSAQYCEFVGQAGPVRVRCLAFAEHEHHARAMVKVAAQAIEAYSRWFGPYPFPDFTIAEAFFGWNGNECGSLIMIDERVFGMPHLASGYIEYLVSHETCHQWWYNVIGTNGYCETWMDEALATYFSHRLLNQVVGKNNDLLRYPSGFEWLPTIKRENYRNESLYGTIGRNEQKQTVLPMTGYGHLFTLFTMNYDKGSKIVGMIEERLGETAFLDFMRLIYTRYQFRILRIADYQRELEAYTGRSWQDFFQQWLYSAGFTDWAVESVKLQRVGSEHVIEGPVGDLVDTLQSGHEKTPYRVTVLVRQKAEINEQTVLGIRLDDSDAYQIRLPIVPRGGPIDIPDPPAHITPLAENLVQVEVTLPCKPTQISVDPDDILVDKEPANNHWKPRCRVHLTPFYTLLDETDLTNDYDRWNIIAGPWLFASAFNDPWYVRSPMVGLRAGVFRTQEFNGGVYAAYRTDFKDVVVGADGLVDHFPWANTQVGFNVEKRLFTVYDGDQHADRATLFGRYVFNYGASLYLPPIHYAETFVDTQDNFLPLPNTSVPGGERFQRLSMAGIHYHLNLLTPYWDPASGFQLDATYQAGVGQLRTVDGVQLLSGQLSTVKELPDGLGWFSSTRLAARIAGAVGLPNRGEYFALGGSDSFRGFDLAERQGSLVWVGSLEWRVPLLCGVEYDVLDHTIGLRNSYAAVFTDVGDALTNNRSVGPVAYAVGAGLRLDVAIFSFVERATVRFDVAKAVNVDTGWQFWLGFTQPF